MKRKVRSIVALLAILALVVILVPLAACDGDTWNTIPAPSTGGTLILDDVMPSPDGTTLFLSTTFNGTYSILWKSPVPGCFGSWSWTMLNIAPTPGWIIRLSPCYLTDQTLYWCDRGGTDIQRSIGGGPFAHRIAPTPIIDVAVEDSYILYLADGSNVYKSTNGGWVWGLPANANAGTIFMLAMAATYPNSPVSGNILVGGTGGAASYSTNGGASFTLFPPLPIGGDVQIAGDTDYASNKTVYAGSSNGGVYRGAIPFLGWDVIRSATDITNVSGLAVNNIGLCASDATPTGGADRTDGPTAPVPLWSFLTSGLTGGETFNQVPSALRCFNASIGNFDLFAIDTANNKLYRYDD